MHSFRSFAVVLIFALAPTIAAASSVEVMSSQLNAVGQFLSRTFSDSAPLTADELRSSVRAGAAWLASAQEENGHFNYEYAPYADDYLRGDNIVRQAGAFYSLGEIARHTKRDSYGVKEAMENAAAYLVSMTKEDEHGREEISCITRTLRSNRCPLGATSLALIGLLSYAEAFPHSAARYEDLIERYSAFILISQKENGGFRTDHIVGEDEQSDKESPFSNGEALLALTRLYMHTEDQRVKAAIDQSWRHLSSQPHDPNLHLWMMAALEDMQRLWPSDEYISYAHDFTKWRIRDGERFTNRTRNYCAYAEGLASALHVLQGSVPLEEYRSMNSELMIRNSRHHRLQLTDTDSYRVLSLNGTLTMGQLQDPDLAHGGFLTGDAEPYQRIDFTQHCITGYVHTLRLMDESL